MSMDGISLKMNSFKYESKKKKKTLSTTLHVYIVVVQIGFVLTQCITQ